MGVAINSNTLCIFIMTTNRYKLIYSNSVCVCVCNKDVKGPAICAREITIRGHGLGVGQGK